MVLAWIKYNRKKGRDYADNLYLNFRDMLEYYSTVFDPQTTIITLNKHL